MKKKIRVRLLTYTFVMGLIMQLFIGVNSAYAADSAQYELKGWKMGIVGNTASINFGYIGEDGASLVSTLPIELSLVEGHGTDPSWTQYDSAAPILAYINKYGINNNIQEAMNASYYDPTILKALSGQGVSLQQLGGPANPQVGKANYNSNIDKVLVGVGVPAPSLSSSSSSSGSSTQSSSQPVSTVKTENSSPSLPPEPTSPTTKPIVDSNVTEAQKSETVQESDANPERLDPPVFAIADTTPTKIPAPQEDATQSKSTNWTTIAEIAAGILLLGGILGGVWWKYGRVQRV